MKSSFVTSLSVVLSAAAGPPFPPDRGAAGPGEPTAWT